MAPAVAASSDDSPRQGRAEEQENSLRATAPEAGVRTFTLSPGERLTFTHTGSARIDRPSLEQVTAWKHGQVTLDNTSLADAVAEMNRYSRQQIVIEDPSTAAIRVSGIFEAGDSENFAEAVARTYHLRAPSRASDVIVLTAGGPKLAPAEGRVATKSR